MFGEMPPMELAKASMWPPLISGGNLAAIVGAFLAYKLQCGRR